MRLSLSLPPLVAILLLAFVWLIVFVLLIWFFLPGGRQPGEAAREDEPPAPRRTQPPTDTRRRNANDRNVSDRNVGDADPSTLPRPRVRAVTAEPKDERPNTQDAFEDYDRSGKRRDGSDF